MKKLKHRISEKKESYHIDKYGNIWGDKKKLHTIHEFQFNNTTFFIVIFELFLDYFFKNKFNLINFVVLFPSVL